MNPRYHLLAAGLLMLAVTGSLSAAEGEPGARQERATAAAAEATWRSELEELCAGTNNAMTFTREELERLISRCERLKQRIDGLDESARKVYGRRLQMCRDFYRFMLEGKRAAGGN